MKYIITALLFAVLSAIEAHAEDLLGWRITVCGKNTYEFKLTESRVNKAPKWKRGESHPPLPPQKAYESAFSQAKTLQPEVTNWQVSQIVLEPVGIDDNGYFGRSWIYIVSLLDFSGPLAGKPARLDLPVYFDGSTIKPIVKR